MNKAQVRAEMKAKKRAMTEAQIQTQSNRLARLLEREPLYQRAQAVYFYLPYNQEIRTWPMIRAAWAAGKRVAVPKVKGDEMVFLWIDADSAIEPGAFRIPEPVADEPVAEEPGALVLMPGLAFDPQGRRIGYGGGYYDKYLSQHPGHPTLALCYDFQLLDRLEVEEHDIRVDRVIHAGEGK